jgi:hypothetical protein
MCNDTYMRWISPTPAPNSPPLSPADWHKLLAGSMSGATVVTFTYPLDIVQTRLATAEAGGGAQYKGIWDCATKMVRNEGWKAFTKGYWPSVLGIMPYTGSQFYAYDKLDRWMQDEKGRTTIPQKLTAGCLAGALPPPSLLLRLLGTDLSSPSFTGVFAQSVSYPLDTVRRRMQVQGAGGSVSAPYKNSIDCARQMWAQEGMRSFYRGLILNAARAGPSQAVQFAR